MNLYVVRHGETDWNKIQRLQGNKDISLNKNGIEQVKNIREEIKNYKIDLIFCSTLKRAKQTADIINEYLNCEIIYTDALKERYYGNFEGTTKNEYTKDIKIQSGLIFNYNVNIKYKGIEPIKDFCNRVWNFLDVLKTKYNDKNILLVTHGGTIAIINTYLNGLDENGNINYLDIKNAKILKYTLK